MGPGGIAVIILASAAAVIAIAIAYAVIRLGRVIDQFSKAIKDVTNETTPLLEEVTTTVKLVNGPLTSLNKVTKTVEDVTTKIAGSTSGFLDKNDIAMKVAGGLLSAAKLRKKSSKKKSRRRKDYDEEDFD
ncbi:MAG: hypothetical protein RJB28_629 [Actinomycetota bacterium]|jgi:uncharacterized protein YoxC|nr:DUF948 domain-containing protein [Actinomycetota bacterium]